MANVNINDLVTPQLIQGFVRNLEYPGFELSPYFPDETVQGFTYRYDTTQLSAEPAIGYRAWDTEAPIRDRQGVTRASQELPPLSAKKLMTEEQYLKYQALQTGDWSAYIEQIYNDLENLVGGIQSQWELNRGTLLSTGSLTINDDRGNAIATLNYNVPGGNIVTAGTLWSSTGNADPISDLTTWVATYKAANRGMAPGEILISETIAGYLVRNVAIASALFPVSGSAPTVVARDSVNAYFQANGLPPFRVISAQATKNDGTVDYVLPQNKVIFVPPRGINVGRTVKGVTASATGLVNSGTLSLAEAPGIVGLTWEQDDPARRFNMVDACGMPVLTQPSMLFIATVGA